MSEKIEMYDVVSEPRGEVYRALLNYAQSICPYFLLVEQPGASIDTDGTALLLSLARFLVEEKETKEWPGTVLLGKRMARAFTFDFTPESARILFEVTDGLYDWRSPSRPEDLCLLRSDRLPWLTSIAHERDSYFKISEDEKEELVAKIPEINSLLAKR